MGRRSIILFFTDRIFRLLRSDLILDPSPIQCTRSSQFGGQHTHQKKAPLTAAVPKRLLKHPFGFRPPLPTSSFNPQLVAACVPRDGSKGGGVLATVFARFHVAHSYPFFACQECSCARPAFNQPRQACCLCARLTGSDGPGFRLRLRQRLGSASSRSAARFGLGIVRGFSTCMRAPGASRPLSLPLPFFEFSRSERDRFSPLNAAPLLTPASHRVVADQITFAKSGSWGLSWSCGSLN